MQGGHRLLERHLQDHGDHLRQLGLSMWGTATMRTGGDDMAQALALMGVPGGRRAANVLNASKCCRWNSRPPEGDVTCASGFFRDAFSNSIRLFG